MLDWLALSGHSWAGRMHDEDFLARLYNLGELGSTDTRFDDAAGDIWQHRTRNFDWDDDWIFTDSRFDLRSGSDENILKFLAETVHPLVRADQEDATYLVNAYNDTLRRDGFEIYESNRMGDRAIYSWRLTTGYRAPTATRLSQHPDLADRGILRQHLTYIDRDLVTDPAAAIASSKNLLETLCKIVLEDRGVEYSDRDDLPGLFGKVAAELSINVDSVTDDRRGSDAIKKAMRTLMTTVQAVAEARNSIGGGHGGVAISPAEPRHARLVFNATISVAEFVLDSWRP